MNKIFTAQESYCACHVLSISTIRIKYFLNFILIRTRSDQELFDHPLYVCVWLCVHFITCLLDCDYDVCL